MSKLISPTAVRRYALERVAIVRPGWPATRVSKNFIDGVETAVRLAIDAKLRQHPSKGETIVWE